MDIHKIKQTSIADFIDKILSGETDNMSVGDAAIMAFDIFEMNLRAQISLEARLKTLTLLK